MFLWKPISKQRPSFSETKGQPPHVVINDLNKDEMIIAIAGAKNEHLLALFITGIGCSSMYFEMKTNTYKPESREMDIRVIFYLFIFFY